jgi:pre-mRNA cleavage complex 2 protein Pcf11
VQYPPIQPSPQPVSSIDLEQLKADLARLIATTKDNFASNPSNVSTQAQLKALLGLETILRTQTLLPQQLEQIRNQIQLSSRPPPAPTPAFVPQVSAPPPLFPGHQQPPLPSFPPGLAQLLANTKPPVPSPSSTPVPAALSLADMLRTVTTPSQSSSAPPPPPSMPPFYAPPYAPIPPPVSTPVPPPAPIPTGTPSANLAELLARFNPPPVPAPASTQSLPLPPFLAQLPPLPPAHGSGDWLLNALKGFGAPGTPANSTPMALEPMARQASVPNPQNAVELTTASMKMYVSCLQVKMAF